MMQNPLEKLIESGPFDNWWPFVIALIVGVVTTIRSYFGGPCCPSGAKINGKTVLITGGSSGIGLYVVKELLERGGKVIVGSRNPNVALQFINKLTRNTSDKLVVKHLDLSSLKSVKEFVKGLEREPKIDILINNAGVAFQEFHKTDEGFETHLVTNYLSHFLLTHLLIKKLKAAEEARIVNVSAQAHYCSDLYLDDMNVESDYSYNKAFGQSKLALVMMARHMAKIFQGTNITINAMHPGIVWNTRQFQKSPIGSSVLLKFAVNPWAWLFMKSPEQGAQTIIYMAVATELRSTSGKYFSNCKIIEPSEKALDDKLGEKLYLKSLELTGLSNELMAPGSSEELQSQDF